METIRIRFREDTAKNWEIANPVLASSEPGRETDTGKFKIGDGKTNWNNLPYVTSEVKEMDNTEVLSAITNTNADITNTINTNNANITTLLTQLQDSVNNLNNQPSTPGKTFEQYLAENGLCKVNYRYNDEDHYQIVPVGSVFDYSIKIPSTQAMLMGWVKENTFEPVLRIEESCTLTPIIHSLNAHAMPFNQAYIFNTSGVMENITNPLSNGLEYSIFNKVEEFDFDIKYEMYRIGLSTTSNDASPMNMSFELFDGNTYYGIYYCPQLNKIYSHEQYHATKSEMIYGDQIKNVNYMTLAGVGYSPLEHANLMNDFNYNEFIYRFKGWTLDSASNTIDNINVYKYLKSSEATNYTYYAIYERRNMHDNSTSLINASYLQSLYDIIVHTFDGEYRVSYDDFRYRNFGIGVYNTWLDASSFTNDSNWTASTAMYDKDSVINNGFKDVYALYYINGQYATVNDIHNAHYITNIYNLNGGINGSIPYYFVNNYIPTDFTSGGEHYTFGGWADTPDSTSGLNDSALMSVYAIYPIMIDSKGNAKTYNESVTLYANKETLVNVWGKTQGIGYSTIELYNRYDEILSQFSDITLVVNDEKRPLTAVGFCYNTVDTFCIPKEQLLEPNFIYTDLYIVYRTDIFDGITQSQIGGVLYQTVDVAPEQLSVNEWYYLNNNSHFNVAALNDQLAAFGLQGSEMSYDSNFNGLIVSSDMIVTSNGIDVIYVRTTAKVDDWTPMSEYQINLAPDFSSIGMGQWESILLPFRTQDGQEYDTLRFGIGAEPIITYINSKTGASNQVYGSNLGWFAEHYRTISFEVELPTGVTAHDWLIANSTRIL